MISFTCPKCSSFGKNLIEPTECPQCGHKGLQKYGEPLPIQQTVKNAIINKKSFWQKLKFWN